MAKDSSTARTRQHSDKIEKIESVTWFGHLVIHLHHAMSELSDEGRLALLNDPQAHLRRYECDLIRHPRKEGAHQ